jgi:cellulose synthase/poly-beta-1,6-N-acetylglucosamine synthase-like glycosyltransferase
MKVSFIVVAYNAGNKLENLLKDLEKQNYNHNDIEIILVDSNSTDNTKDIMIYAQRCGYRAAADMLLLIGPDGFYGDYTEYEDLMAFLESEAK